jgi:predicted small secreted protein
MATYYVATYGSNSNNGTSPATPWSSISFAIGAASGTNPGLSAGDTVWVAPGVYRESLSAALQYLGGNGTAGSPITIKGDPLVTQAWTATSAGLVRWTANPSDTTNPITGWALLTATSKNYINWESLYFDTWVSGYAVNLTTCRGWSFTKCVFSVVQLNSQIFTMTNTAGTPYDFTLDRCVLAGGQCFTVSCARHSSTYDVNINIKDSIFLGCPTTAQAMVFQQSGTGSDGNGVKIYNSHFQGFDSQTIYIASTNTTHNSIVKNCVLIHGNIFGSTIGAVAQTYNRLIGVTLQNTATSVTTSTDGSAGLSLGYERINGLLGNDIFAPYQNSPNAGYGNNIGAPLVDLYSATWTGNPNAGAVQKLEAVYQPTERNQSLMQISADSTSRSLYLYLGATGLTATTTGLQAYYTKEDAAPVSIPLVAQTTTGAWVSGGFAEVSAANQPGVYRLDIPDAAISAAYTQTVVTVRGASGTNGAVVVIQEPPILGSQVRMGPFTVQADGVLTDERLKLFKGSIHSIDFKMVDQYGTGVDGTGTVVTANAYNSAGFLVDSYPCTAKYAEDGRYSFAIDATVTNVVGMYTINISRQIGSEINVFGRMKLEVLSP